MHHPQWTLERVSLPRKGKGFGIRTVCCSSTTIVLISFISSNAQTLRQGQRVYHSALGANRVSVQMQFADSGEDCCLTTEGYLLHQLNIAAFNLRLPRDVYTTRSRHDSQIPAKWLAEVVILADGTDGLCFEWEIQTMSVIFRIKR